MNIEKDQPSFTTVGRVVDTRSHAGIPDLQVEAWTRATGCTELVAAATTGAGGEFTLEMEEETLRQLIGPRPPSVFFRVFQGEQQLIDTEATIAWHVRSTGGALCIPVDLVSPQGNQTPARRAVRGRLTDPSGSPLLGVRVEAFDRNVGRPESSLGQAVTDAAGRYQITYTQDELGRVGKQHPDLAVRAYDGNGMELAARFICRAPPTAIVDLTTAGDARGPSEVERLTSAVLPVLGETALAQLSDDDIALAGCSAGVDRDQLALLVAAHGLADDTDMSPHVFYGVLRWGLPAERARLFMAGLTTYRQALTWAVEENLIPEMSEAAIEEAARKLASLFTLLASEEKTPGAGSLDDLLGTALPTPTDRQLFLERYMLHEGPVSEFWQSLRDEGVFSEDQIAGLQRTIQIGALTRHHLPLARKLEERFQTGTYQSLRDLAKLDVDGWRQLLEENNGGTIIGAPSTVPGATDAERIQNYASVLTWSLETAFPGAALAGRLGAASPALADALQILSSDPNFELGRTRIADYAAEHPEVLSGVADQAVTVAQIEAMERLHKLTPSASEIKALMDLGFDSAQSIVRLGRGRFHQFFDGALGAGRVEAIYSAARQVSASSHAIALRYHAIFHTLSAYALPKPAAPAGGQVGSWPALFGSLDFCACGHCNSVYSPAAYLVDLLQFLDRQDSKLSLLILRSKFDIFTGLPLTLPFTSRSARDVLLARRPDIASLELTCENTNTPVPYVDLVNEILEYAVANTQFTDPIDFPDHIATEGTPSELAAEPQPPAPSKQVVHDTAYQFLATQPYPWRLPFNLGQEQARIYFDHLGVPRDRHMEALRIHADLDPEFPIRLALERLRLSDVDGQLITGTFAGGPWLLWGLLETGNSIPDPSGAAQTPIQGSWIDVLRHVAVLLQRSGMTYDELTELLGTDFVNPPPKSLVIQAAPDADPLTCKLGELRVPALDEPALDRFHRFTRLRRALGWTAAELDQAIRAFGGQIDQAFLIKLADIVWLKAELRVPVLEILAWWGPIQTRSPVASERSLYEQLFLNKAVNNPIDEVFRLNDEGTELAVTSHNIAAHSAAVVAALRLTAADLSLLVDASVSQAELHRSAIVDGDPHDLHLNNLSKLFRATSLARVLKLSIRELLALDAMSGLDVFDTQDPAVTRRFIEAAQQVRASRFGIAQLDYLLRHVAPPSTGVAPDPAIAEAVLANLAAGLEPLVAEADAEAVAPEVEDTGEPLAQLLSRVLPADQIELAESLVNRTSDATTSEQQQFIDTHLCAFLDPVDATTKLLGETPLLTTLKDRHTYVRRPLLLYIKLQEKLARILPPERVTSILRVITGTSPLEVGQQHVAIDEDLSTFLDPLDAKAQLVGPGTLTTKDSRISYVLTPLSTYLRRLEAESLVRQRLGEALRLDAASMEYLLTSALDAEVGGNRKAIADFLGGLDGASAPSDEHRRRAYVRLQKVSSLIQRLKLTAEELRQILAPEQAPRLFNLQQLNVSPASSAPSLFEGWLQLVALIRLRDALPAGKAALVELFQIAPTVTGSGGHSADLLAEISGRTGWPLADLVTLAGPEGRFADTFANLPFGEQLLRLSDASAVLKRLGISAATAVPWADGDTSPADARATAISIRNAVKAKYDDKEWSAIARPLRDVLRERQRAALVDTLVWKRGFTDAKQLFNELLVDVETSPCQLTSRIKQAIGSVQLFVQRAFLNLENDVTLDDEAAREWKWMKNYRVWEANRKIFLYPENWIEPDLRDDKTPFFEAMENELLQSDLDSESAENAFRGYLTKLDQVARLEVMGMFRQKEGSGKNALDILHVFARTRDTPHVHYYRRRMGDATWTAWEKIDLDIQSEHLIPVVFERRLLLFWAIIEEKPEENQDQSMGGPDQPGRAPTTELHIQIAWSEHKNGKWTARRNVDTPAIRVRNLLPPGVLAKRIHFRAFPRLVLLGSESPELVVRCLRSVSLLFTSSPTRAQSSWLGDFVLSGCRGRWRLDEHTQVQSSRHRRPGRARQDEMAIFESTSSKNDGRLYLLAGKLEPGPQKQLGDAGEQITTLNSTPGQFRILFPHVHEDFLSQDSFFYEDSSRSFFVKPRTHVTIEWTQASKMPLDIPAPVWPDDTPTTSAEGIAVSSLEGGGDGASSLIPVPTAISLELRDWANSKPEIIHIPHVTFHHRFQFETFYHPFACDFIRQLNRYGLDGLLDWSRQSTPLQLASRDNFAARYQPTDAVTQPYPVEDVDFSPGGAYSAYNWELFFHAPLLIADRLSKNLRFEEAQRWFHAIFDPTTGSTAPVPQRFWKVRPFHENTDLAAIDELLAGDVDALSKQIEAWRRNPFNPHLIARLRPLAYQKTVVMKYIDNLVRWADQLFRRDTIESINEATQLYLLAAEILGPRPQSIPPRAAVPPKTYRELEPLLDDFFNALIQIEGWAPSGTGATGFGGEEDAEPLVMPSVLYFCVPPNDMLLGYWDTIADRLFKIRNCMNIEGIVRQLPLFEPPIDPALLVRATAAGVDLSTVLQDLSVPAPHHRFQILLQKANELCAEVKALGQALLAAREKRDAEALSLLRSSHEMHLLDAVRKVKERQVNEARESLAALHAAREMASLRHQFYRDVPFLNSWETGHLKMNAIAAVGQNLVEQTMLGAAVAHSIPTLTMGGAGWAATPVSVTTPVDGAKIGAALEAGAKAASIMVSQFREAASVSATFGGYHRRWDDWKLQERVAAREVAQIEKQIAAAEVRVAIAEKDLENHDLQAEQARELDAYLRDKFTSQALYDWMTSQTAAVYFQAYQLAYDLAKRAEKAFRFERGVSSSSYIQFGHWDSLRKGLLAGERLSLDLKRLELAYLEHDRRELELTKHVSLAQHDPAALMSLKATGECFITLPEQLFDMDFPGHYMRRIKNVSLTLPCVVGPYDSVNCTLTILSSKVRVSPDASGDYAALEEGKVVHGFTPTQSIATSHGQADSGMFEVNFRDERYLPFEGAGAVSQWRLELPADTQAFDVGSLQDVVMHLNYTARDGGELMREAAREARDEWIASAQYSGPLARMFSLRQQFPIAWQSFVQSTGTAVLEIPLEQERFPVMFRDKDIQIRQVELYLKTKAESQSIPSISVLAPSETPPPQDGQPAPPIFYPIGPIGSGLLRGVKEYTNGSAPGSWTLSTQPTDAAALEDIALICYYSVHATT